MARTRRVNSLAGALAQVPKWEPLSDDDDAEVTEASKAWSELHSVEAEIEDLQKQLVALVQKRNTINAKLNALPGARYEPTSPMYDPCEGA